MKFNEDQLHTAISLYLAGRIMEVNVDSLWEPLTPVIKINKVPNDLGKVLMIKNVGVGAIIIYSYAIENLVKSFSPQIKRRHLNIIDIPLDLGLNEIEALIFIKTIFPLLKDGYLRYDEPRQEQNIIAPEQTRNIFIKIFKYYIHKFSINLRKVKCFEIEFFNFHYPSLLSQC